MMRAIFVLIAIYLLLLFASACTTMQSQTGEDPPAAAYKLAWKNDAWSKELHVQIDKHFAAFDSAADDMQRFCPKYKSLMRGERILAWAHLFVTVASFESSFNPETKFLENKSEVAKGAEPHYSRGLFQMSYGDGNGCPKSEADGNLHDPIENIQCAVQKAAFLVGRDRLVAIGNRDMARADRKGMACYWSVIMSKDSQQEHHLEEIMEAVAQSPYCS